MAVLAAMLVYGSMQPKLTVEDRAKRECDRMHPYSEIDSNNCQISLLARYVIETRAIQMDRAYERIK
jgi:hypothetical protein